MAKKVLALTCFNYHSFCFHFQKAASVGEKRKYSPLSSRSLYNLTTSPIINRTLPPSGDQDSNDDQPPSKRPRCKASKKLY